MVLCMRSCLALFRAKTQHDDDDYKVEEKTGVEEANYYMQAHSVRETVYQQASIMVNGLLKEYQVRPRTCPVLLVYA